MQRLRQFIGQEHELGAVDRALRDFAQSQQASAVGAMLVSCADETEREAGESFQHWLVDGTLPELKPWCRAPFRLANLGGRYEWGSIALAEQHFATPETRQHFKLLVVKLHAHVGVSGAAGKPEFGTIERYGVRSPACSALGAFVQGQSGPTTDALREAFASEGKDRLGMLQDPDLVPAHLRSLLVAVTHARLQARLAVVDIQNHVPESPTLYLVVPAVTLNRAQRDTQLVVGMYLADRRGEQVQVEYHGLEDDPSRYYVSRERFHVQIEDAARAQTCPRQARDHRQEVLTLWQKHGAREKLGSDRRVEKALHAAARTDKPLAREALKTLSYLLLDLAPIPLALVLFTKGIAGIHHLYQVHRLARGEHDELAAKRIVNEFLSRVDQLPREKVQEVFNTLAEHHALVNATNLGP